MGHNITAVIGTADVISRVIDVAGCPSPTELRFGLQIAPLGHQQIDQLTQLQPGERFAEFRALSAGLQNALQGAAGESLLAYIETNYFGGAGSQAAAVLSGDRVLMRAAIPVTGNPARKDDPINAALRMLGVQITAGEDEFDALGLRRFRDLETLGLDDGDDE